MRRIDVVRSLAAHVTEMDLVISSLGSLWDDWRNLRQGGPEASNTFAPALLGGHSAMSLGLALAQPERRVICIDTDGSLLLNLGVLCTIGNERPGNLTIVIIDNGRYESVGGHRSHSGRSTDLAAVAEGAGCPSTARLSTIEAVDTFLEHALPDEDLNLAVAQVEAGKHEWPPSQRRDIDGVEDKYRFRRHVRELTMTGSQ